MSVDVADIKNFVPVAIEDEMKKSYLDYAMSVIVSRAIPDARDGLKPVHRRILFAMYESGCDFNKPYKKSARIVGEVMGKYHPHGDNAIYDALVRMAQNFSLRLPLIDGQGNFGSMDGDSPAAMRYTESRLAKVTHTMLDDIDKNTVNFQENYDGSEKEPLVLPSKFPNILVNGAGGIAVGMATNIPTHNLGEIIDACCAYIDNTDITSEELLEFVKGPDFPTGGVILGQAGIKSALLTGRGSVIIRGKVTIENIKEKRQAIIINEIPYQVNKAKMLERFGELVREKKIEGISALRDESDKSGVRVVVELKKDTIAEVVLNQLYSYTSLQTSFGVNMLALDRGQPKLMNLLDIIKSFIEFREEVITRRTSFLLSKSREKAHILIGLVIAVANIDEVISLIRTAPDPQTAKERLIEKEWLAENVESLITLVAEDSNNLINGKCYLTEIQAKAILEMRLQRLTGLEHEKLSNELQELAKEIIEYLSILGNRSILMTMIRDDLLDIKEKFSNPRRTEIELSEFEHDIESLIPKEDMVVTVTMAGYIKRVPLSTYKSQRRGGKGRSGITIRDEDETIKIFIANTHTPVLFFSTNGKVYKLKVYKIPLATPQSKGRALVNIFPLSENETINQVMPLPEDESSWDNFDIFFATSKANVRRNSLCDFRSVQSNGKIAMKLDDDDTLIGIKVCKPDDHIFLASKKGKCVRFPVNNVRIFKSRTSDGVRGMRLDEDDKVVSMSVLYPGGISDIEVRDQYLKIPVENRMQISTKNEGEDISHLINSDINLSEDKIREMAKYEQFILSITVNGFGKRTSAYEYRITNRGGSGVVNIITSERNGHVVASMTIREDHQIIMLSDKGTLIRCPTHDIRITSRNTNGVTLFKTSKNEVVVSVAKIQIAAETEEDDNIDEENIAIDPDNAPLT